MQHLEVSSGTHPRLRHEILSPLTASKSEADDCWTHRGQCSDVVFSELEDQFPRSIRNKDVGVARSSFDCLKMLPRSAECKCNQRVLISAPPQYIVTLSATSELKFVMSHGVLSAAY